MSVEARDLRCYVTQAGFNQEAQDKQLGRETSFTHILIDGDLLPDEVSPGTLVAVQNEIKRYPVTNLVVDPDDASVLIIDAVIPADDGGFTINGLGVLTSRDVLYAYARTVGDYKPQLSAGAGTDMVVRIKFVPTNADQITVQVDPSTVLATQEGVGAAVLVHEQKADPHPQYAKDTELQALSQQLAVFSPKILGEPFWHLGESPPDKALFFAGQILSRTDYSELWAALNQAGRNITIVSDSVWLAGRKGVWSSGDGSTTFRAPEVRGDVIRVLDGGRGVDLSRVMGSYQEDQMGEHSHGYFKPGVNKTFQHEQGWADIGSAGSSNSATDNYGGVETRMKNTAWPLAFWYE